MSVLFHDVVLLQFASDNNLDVEGGQQIVGDLVRSTDEDIIDVSVSHGHEDSLVEGKDRVVRALEGVNQLIIPNSDIEEVTKLSGFLDKLYVSIMEAIERTSKVDDLVTGLRLLSC